MNTNTMELNMNELEAVNGGFSLGGFIKGTILGMGAGGAGGCVIGGCIGGPAGAAIGTMVGGTAGGLIGGLYGGELI